MRYLGGVMRVPIAQDGANDAHEKAADQMADRAMRAPDNQASNAPAQQQRAGSAPGDPSGRPLPSPLREVMERRFGADFSGVRLHTDSAATAATRAVHARAFTTGQNIALAADYRDLGSGPVRRLLAHELAHTLQQASGGVIRRQKRSTDELQQRLNAVRRELETGTGVRSPEASAKLRAEEQGLMAELRQNQTAELERQLAANRKQQQTGAGVRSAEETTRLKEQDQELQMRIALVGATAVHAGNIVPGAASPPYIDWAGGNLRGLGAERQVLNRSYPGFTQLPEKFPGVDFVGGGQRTPLTGTGVSKGLKVPFADSSFYFEGGTLVQLKVVKNLDPTYLKPNGLYNKLSSQMDGLANIQPGAGRSAMQDGQFVRSEYLGNAQRKVFHVEMEAPPTPEQLAQIEQLKKSGASMKTFGPGEEIEVVVNWPGSGAKGPKISMETAANAATLGLAVLGAHGREELRKRQLAETGYAPIGLAAHQDETGVRGLAMRLGAFFRGDQAEMLTSAPSMPNMPVWRANIRRIASTKRPGDTLVATWQTQDRSMPMPFTVDVEVIYEKQQDGRWRVRSTADAPAHFQTPDLNTILAPERSDGDVENMLGNWPT
jgi:hypothetical protein